ncbi:MAG: 23S rRNA (guanosine(2251)-2'-O)-methyltransferase RlmB, partial [Clostridia bacterium]|nr:23S rRNA (guanosine(2251)-2'-O)-methyltransferase RlmB [Clostridia bacterium]
MKVKRETPRTPDENAENRVFGRNAVRELLASGRDIDKIYVSGGEREGSILRLIGEARERRIPIVECDRRKLDLLSGGGVHQGIVAVAAEVAYASVDDMLALA